VTLSDLIDLEAQLARDREVDPGALAVRDRAWVRDSGHPARDREALLARWLDAARDAQPERLHPGASVERALRTTRALLAVAGLVVGWASATALLEFTGDHPVNVWDFLLVFVATQVLLLVVLGASFFVPLGAFGRPAFGIVRSAVGALHGRFAMRSARGRERAAEWGELWHRLRSRRSLYQHVEPWLLLGVTQGFGVAFNLGALLAFLRLVVFSDLAFAWSTTLVELDAERFHAVAAAGAAPGGGVWRRRGAVSGRTRCRRSTSSARRATRASKARTSRPAPVARPGPRRSAAGGRSSPLR
jgi:hypothetical protein